jgi:hypothetical protein
LSKSTKHNNNHFSHKSYRRPCNRLQIRIKFNSHKTRYNFLRPTLKSLATTITIKVWLQASNKMGVRCSKCRYQLHRYHRIFWLKITKPSSNRSLEVKYSSRLLLLILGIVICLKYQMLSQIKSKHQHSSNCNSTKTQLWFIHQDTHLAPF